MIYTISNIDPTISWGMDSEMRIVQNVLNIIRTRKYEVPFMRDFGIDPNYTDNTQSYAQEMLKDEIINIVEQYEPRAVVKDVYFKNVDNDGSMIYEVEIEV